MAEGMKETKQDAATELAQKIMDEYNAIPLDQQPLYSVFSFNKGLRLAEEIARDIATIELHVRVGVGDELKTYTVIVPRIGPLKVCDGIHIKTLRSAAQAIRAEREKLS